MIWYKFILTLSFAFIINFCYAKYINNVSKVKPLKAALFGELVTICIAINIINYVNNQLYLIPVIIGGFVGTYISVKK